jgi:branched-chain amino acid transport system ATP-binding protein
LATDALRLDGLDAFYGDSHVLHGLSLALQPGRMLALLGRNGAGKSTTVGAIVGLVRSRARGLYLFGEPIGGLPPEAISRRGVGVVPQGRRIFPSLTVHENLTVAARDKGLGSGPRWTLKEVFEAFPRLGERQRQFAGSLSGGEQQMLAIGRALMTNPRLLLLDEPSEGLAPQIVAEVADVLVRLRASGLPIILVEQNIDLALRLADDVAILNSGQLAHTGSAASVRADPALLNRLLGIY